MDHLGLIISPVPPSLPSSAEGAMLLERTIFQLDTGLLPPDRAEAMGQLGYIQWLGGLPGNADYLREARRAYDLAQPFAATSSAIVAFRALLAASLQCPLQPLALKPPAHGRRGGAQARRMRM